MVNFEQKRTTGKIINELLKENNISQKELAEHLVTPHSTASYYACGKRMPTLEHLIFMADFFGVSVDYLLGKTKAKSKNEDMVMICKYTGLDEHVLKILHNHSNNKQYMRFIESNILSTAIILDNEKE